MVGGSLLHGLPLVGLPNIYYIYIYIYIIQKMGLGPWGLGAVGFDINQKILFFFIFYFLKQCIFLKGCKLSERLHSGFLNSTQTFVFGLPGILNKFVHSFLREKKQRKSFAGVEDSCTITFNIR